MRVSVYREEDGKMAVLVEGSVGKGRAPVLLRGITGENVVETVLPLVEAMRLPKGSKPTEA